MPSKSIHIAVNGKITLFIFKYYFTIHIHTHTHTHTTEDWRYIYIYIYTHTYIYHIFFIQSPIDGYLSCFDILAIINNTTMKTVAYLFRWLFKYIFFFLYSEYFLHLLRWPYGFYASICWYDVSHWLIDFQILKNPCIPGMIPLDHGM